jgi:hypothetical protein
VNLAAGSEHTVALKSDGTVWAWGNNAYGQLGDGTTNQHTTPVQASGLTGVAGIDAGLYFSVARTTSGAAFSWVRNESGQLGEVLLSGSACITMLSLGPAGTAWREARSTGERGRRPGRAMFSGLVSRWAKRGERQRDGNSSRCAGVSASSPPSMAPSLTR